MKQLIEFSKKNSELFQLGMVAMICVILLITMTNRSAVRSLVYESKHTKIDAVKRDSIHRVQIEYLKQELHVINKIALTELAYKLLNDQNEIILTTKRPTQRNLRYVELLKQLNVEKDSLTNARRSVQD